MLLAILVATGIVLTLVVIAIFWIRDSASKHQFDPKTKVYTHTWWTFLSANMDAAVVGKQNVNMRSEETGTVVKTGGEIIDWIHGIPGKRRVKPSADSTTWYLEDGEEDWGFFHWLTNGAIFLGPWKELRVVTLHDSRFSRTKGEDTYSIEPKDYDTLWVHHSGALAVKIHGAETKGTFKIDMDLNLIYERKYFIRSILRVADANSVLTIMAESKITGIVGPLTPEEVLAGTEAAKEKVAAAVLSISSKVEAQIGLTLFDPEFYNFDIEDEDRKLLELAERTRREQDSQTQIEKAKAERAVIAQDVKSAVELKQAETNKQTKVLEAQGDREAGILRNDVPADFVERVTLKVAREPNGPAVRAAEAYEKNQTVVVSGANMLTSLPSEFLRRKVLTPEEAGSK